MKYPELNKIMHDLLLADKNLERKQDAYFALYDSGRATRRTTTTHIARRMIATEWLSKCELDFEQYINNRIIAGKFYLTNTPELKKRIEQNTMEGK